MSKRPKIQNPRTWRFPKADRVRLDNGITVLLYHRPGQYVISTGLVLDIPLSAENADREGVATLCLRCLDEGTTTYPGTAFANRLELQGADIAGSAEYDASHLRLEVPRSHYQAALPLLAEMVIRPQLAESDIERHRTLRVAEIRQCLAQSSYRAATTFRGAAVDQKYRIAREVGGTTATVSAVGPQDVRTFHRQTYGPAGTTIVAAGDFTADPSALLARCFGDWQNPAQQIIQHQTPRAARRQCILVHRPGAVQADVRLGTFTIDRTDPRWADFQVASHAIGGAFLSRLNKILREARGFTYGAHFAVSPMRHGGLAAVQGSFRPDSLVEALDLARSLLDVNGDPLTETEITQGIQYFTGATPLQFSTAASLVDNICELVSVGLTSDFVDSNLDALSRVTAESATEAFAQLVEPDQLTLVVVGDADKLAGPLIAAGWPVEVTGP